MTFSVLIVEDNKKLAKTFANLLISSGYEALVVSSGKEALEILSTKNPKIVLLDIGMLGMDGYQVAKEIRKREEFSETILVALTGYGQMEDKLKAREAGFNHHIEKPATFDEIRRILNVYDF